MIFPFMKFKWFAVLFSTLIAGHLFYHTYSNYSGFKQGLDFSGGLKLEIEENKTINVEKLRKFFKKKNIQASVLSAGGSKPIIKIEIDTIQDTSFEKEAEKKL